VANQNWFLFGQLASKSYSFIDIDEGDARAKARVYGNSVVLHFYQLKLILSTHSTSCTLYIEDFYPNTSR
jgi:hypothetical protein